MLSREKLVELGRQEGQAFAVAAPRDSASPRAEQHCAVPSASAGLANQHASQSELRCSWLAGV